MTISSQANCAGPRGSRVRLQGFRALAIQGVLDFGMFLGVLCRSLWGVEGLTVRVYIHRLEGLGVGLGFRLNLRASRFSWKVIPKPPFCPKPQTLNP